MPLFESAVGVQELTEADGAMYLEQNIPNPSNSATTIRYTLPAATNARLTVFTPQGKKVAVLYSGYQEQGTYSVAFPTGNLPVGSYYYQLETEHFKAVKSMIIAR